MNGDPLIGRQLGNYRIEHLLGRGGMAQVYYAWDVTLQRPAAIKAIDARYRDDPAYATRFIQEARVVATWRHPNIVHIYYAGEEEGLYFFAMEYVEGQSLDQLISNYVTEGRRMPYRAVLHIGRAVAAALDYAHLRAVIHRDVKPSNVMITNDGRVVLTDFGLALDVERGTLGETFGSPHYIAPEQARRSSDAVPQSDLYSLGVMLYEMLTGQVPFDDPSPAALALQHLTLAPPPPTTLNPDLSDETEAVLLKSLSKSPEARYPSGQALLDALAQALGESAQMTGTVLRKTPRLPILLLVLTILVALTIAVVSWLYLGSQTKVSVPQPTNTYLQTPVPDTVTVSRGIPSGIPGTPDPLPTQVSGVMTLAPTTGPEATATLFESVTEPAVSGITYTPAASPVSSPGATVLYPEGYRLILIYNPYGFYLWNPGQQRVPVSPISFEALNDVGESSIYRFDGTQWAVKATHVERGLCDFIELYEYSGSVQRPAECGNQFNALRTPVSTSSDVFWVVREGISQFRVLWDGQELARCAIADGKCEIRLPW